MNKSTLRQDATRLLKGGYLMLEGKLGTLDSSAQGIQQRHIECPVSQISANTRLVILYLRPEGHPEENRKTFERQFCNVRSCCPLLRVVECTMRGRHGEVFIKESTLVLGKA